MSLGFKSCRVDKMYFFLTIFFCWGGNDKEGSQSAVGELENVKWVLNKNCGGVTNIFSEIFI